jgi:hypothetical protein
MYKSLHESHDHLKRIGSASTRPSRRGIIRDVPAWAKEPEEYYNSLLEQYDQMTDQLHDLRERVIWLKKQLKARLPFETFKQLKDELDFAGPRLSELEINVGQLRTITRAAAVNAWGTVFYKCAELILDRETFLRIDDQAKEILQRQCQELGKAHSEKSRETKKAENRKTQLKRRRKTFRDAYDRGLYQQSPQWNKGMV